MTVLFFSLEVGTLHEYVMTSWVFLTTQYKGSVHCLLETRRQRVSGVNNDFSFSTVLCLVRKELAMRKLSLTFNSLLLQNLSRVFSLP